MLVTNDYEYIFVQSEFYLGSEGEPGSYAKMLAEEFDVVAFNGYANQYLHDPITDVEVGERVRHKFANVPRGAIGAFVVGDVDPAAAGH